MRKSIYRIMGIIVSFALALGGFIKVEATPSQPAASDKPVYAYYYLWWSDQHWEDKLGPNYPYKASPLPLPAKTDANGCSAVSKYKGNELLDVPTKLISQDDPGAIEDDIRIAKKTGLTGFWLNWSGDGTTSQTRTSVSYTRRLSEAFAASKRVGGFKNWVSYKAAAREPAGHIINDLNFLYKEFKDETAWERIDGKPVVTFTGSRTYSAADVQKISSAVRDRIYLVGDESRQTLTSARIKMFDAITYYWSTQDPYGNPQSFDQIREMSNKVRAAGKKWYAPLTPGYNSVLLGTGSCIPRKNGETLRAVWKGNAASNPDGWGLISWNEIAENSHIKPMQKWGSTYVNVLASLIGSPSQPAPTVGLGKYDDWHAGWTYSGFTATTTTGPYKGTMYVSKAVGGTAKLTFTGSQIQLWYSEYNNRGKLKVYLDDDPTPIATIDQYNATRVWQASWTSGDLGAGKHTLKLVHASGGQVDIDAVEVREFQNSGLGKYDDVYAGWMYNDFIATTTDGPYKGTFHYSKVVEGTAEVEFTGSQIAIWYSKYDNRGKLKVYVGNDLIATLDQYGSGRTWQAKWTSENLGAGKHTLKLVHAGPDGTTVDIDAIEVMTYQSSSSSDAVVDNNVQEASVPDTSTAADTAPTPTPEAALATPAPETISAFDDKDAAFDYSSSAWKKVKASKAFGGSYRETTKNGSFVTLPFTGESFSILYKSGKTFGKLDVYVDDVLVETLDQKSPETIYQKRWDYPGQLSAGDHTLKLVFQAVSSTVNKGSLDAVIVR